MREIRIPRIDWDEIGGAAVVIPVAVDWPELRLTKDQILANSIAMLDGEPEPFPNPAIFNVRIER